MESPFEVFFIQVPPPFEDLAISEAKDKYQQLFDKELKTIFIAGGFKIEVTFREAFILNHYLKIPNRILWVIKEFKCRDFPKLYKQISKIRWKNYFADKLPHFKITTKESRLINTTKMEKTIIDAFQRSHIMYPVSKKDKELTAQYQHFNLFIKVNNDTCTLSIDTTGERMSLRNERTHVGLAPIRENLAAALFYNLTKNLKGNINLIDPMCGSGVFLIEAINFHKPSQKRNFSFQFFPKYLFDYKLKDLQSNKTFSIYGSDLSFEQLENCKYNLKQNNIKASLVNCDLFKLTKEDLTYDKNVIILNPPYGKRLKINLKELESKTIKAIKKLYSPCDLGIICNFNQKNTVLKFKNGGIKLNYCIFNFKK